MIFQSMRCGMLVFLLILLLSLAGCSTAKAPVSTPVPQLAELPQSQASPEISRTVAPRSSRNIPPLALGIDERMALGLGELDAEGEEVAPSPEPVYSFRTGGQGMPLVQALELFARTYRLNIIIDPEVTGTVSVNFNDLPLDRAMESILDMHGYFWEWDDGLIRVNARETRSFTIDYLRLVRAGSGSSQAKVSSGSSGGEEAGSVNLMQKDSISFWEELENQLKELVSEDARLVINRLTGTVQVTDLHPRIVEIEKFIASLLHSMHREVEIEAKIIEVTLSDDSALGIDWTRVDLGAGASKSYNTVVSALTAVTAPFGGNPVKAPTATVTYTRNHLDAIISALREQGEIKVVSQPRILSLNNQPAMIKVGTDQAFFTQDVTIDNGVSTVTDNLQTVTIGVVLSITPQISEDGWIMLDVSPIITRLVGTVTSPQGSTAPILDVKQSSTIVRMRDGEMMVIGGLIQDEMTDTSRKVPFLGDLPMVGPLFSGTYRSKVKRELVVFLAPRIIEH